jgi:hypothetical protein
MPIEKQDVKIGMRVQDGNGNVGTVRWMGRMEKAQKPPDNNVGTYCGVEFDEPHGGIRRGNGIWAGKEYFTAPAGTVEFVKPATLWHERNTAGINALRAHFGVRIAHMHDVLLVKYLIARKYELPKVFEMLDKQLKWAETAKPSATEYLPPEIAPNYPIGFAGNDREGNLLYFERPGNGGRCTPVNFVKKFGLGQILRWHITTMEMGRELLKATGYKAKRITAIIDLKDLGECDRHTVQFGKMIAQVDQDYYPEHLSKLFIINAPGFFAGLWRVIRVFVDPRTREKIHVLDKNYKTELEQYIDHSQLPSFCGGANDAWLSLGGVAGGSDPSKVVQATEVEIPLDEPLPDDSPLPEKVPSRENSPADK